MFELSEKTVEQIAFAMEDQEHASVVDLESGEVLPAEGYEGPDYAEAPTWSSREGFKLMEDFLASVRQPSVRRELSAALARGRGVFKAFKAVLAEREDVERSFRDFKMRAMRLAIANWYDDLREARGLERLGPEPEEVDELLTSDLDIRILGLDEARSLLLPLIDEAEEEGIETCLAPWSPSSWGGSAPTSPPPRTRFARRRRRRRRGARLRPRVQERRRRPRPGEDRLPEGTARVQANGSGYRPPGGAREGLSRTKESALSCSIPPSSPPSWARASPPSASSPMD